MRLIADHIYPDLIDLISRAQGLLLLVSPYWHPNQRVETELERAAQRGVTLYLIARGGDDRAAQEEKLRSVRTRLPCVQASFVERLHAKFYLSESEAIVTSMNMHEASALDSIEVGVRLTKAQHPDVHQGLLQFGGKLIDIGTQDQLRARLSVPADAPRPRTPAAPRERAPAPRRCLEGHCLRCKDAIELNVEKPLCGDCYSRWAEYKNPEYEEKYCHACGSKTSTSILKPLCRSCWKRGAA